MKLTINTSTKTATEDKQTSVELDNDTGINTGSDLLNILALVFKNNEPLFEPRQGVSIKKPEVGFNEEQFVENEIGKMPEIIVEEPGSRFNEEQFVANELESLPEFIVEEVEEPKETPTSEQLNKLKDSVTSSKHDTFNVLSPEEIAKTVANPDAAKKTVDLLGSKSTGFTVEERLAAEAEDPNRRVKVWVNCVSCDFEGPRGSKFSRLYYICPNCGEKLYLCDATDIPGERDDKGYVLLAQEKYITREELYNRNKEKEEAESNE